MLGVLRFKLERLKETIAKGFFGTNKIMAKETKNKKKRGKSTFEKFRSKKNGEYYFVLKSSNGKVLFASEGYMTKAGRDNGISAIRETAAEADEKERDDNS